MGETIAAPYAAGVMIMEMMEIMDRVKKRCFILYILFCICLTILSGNPHNSLGDNHFKFHTG
jgi:hypothetical protein